VTRPELLAPQPPTSQTHFETCLSIAVFIDYPTACIDTLRNAPAAVKAMTIKVVLLDIGGVRRRSLWLALSHTVRWWS
jgi:hypothetical protein